MKRKSAIWIIPVVSLALLWLVQYGPVAYGYWTDRLDSHGTVALRQEVTISVEGLQPEESAVQPENILTPTGTVEGLPVPTPVPVPEQTPASSTEPITGPTPESTPDQTPATTEPTSGPTLTPAPEPSTIPTPEQMPGPVPEHATEKPEENRDNIKNSGQEIPNTPDVGSESQPESEKEPDPPQGIPSNAVQEENPAAEESNTSEGILP